MGIYSVHNQDGITLGDLKTLVKKATDAQIPDTTKVEVSNDSERDVKIATDIFADDESIWIY